IRYGKSSPTQILGFYEGPEATVSAVEYASTARMLVIDGFIAAGQVGVDETAMEHYMPWMGHLPMALHPDRTRALVICFGTGQTANALRNENPDSLDIVDINPNVPKMSHLFPSNQGVLDDPRIHLTIMDGRAFVRRTAKTYDVITLEPM